MSDRSTGHLQPHSGHSAAAPACRRRHCINRRPLVPIAGCCTGLRQMVPHGESPTTHWQTRLHAWAALQLRLSAGARRRRRCGEWRSEGQTTCPQCVQQAAKRCRCTACPLVMSQISCSCCPSELVLQCVWGCVSTCAAHATCGLRPVAAMFCPCGGNWARL